MNIPRELALDLFGLKENFSNEELSFAYRRLVKIVHPDNGGDEKLFIFITACKNVLTNNFTESTEISSKPQINKVRGNISLSTLNEIHFDLDRIMKKYDIDFIRLPIKVYVYPKHKPNMQEIIELSLKTSFNDYLDSGQELIDFSETIYLPSKFSKFKRFHIRLVYWDSTEDFNINVSKSPIKRIITFRIFSTIMLNLLFKYS